MRTERVNEWDEDWRLGRLAEDNDGEVLKALKGRMFASIPRRGYAAPAHRSSRPVSGDGRTVCYVRVESRRKGVRGDREAALQAARAQHAGHRVYVFPPRGEGAAARGAGAIWDRRVGAHYMRPGTAPDAWVSDGAERAWTARERSARGRSGDGLAMAHLSYVERGGDDEAEDLVFDEEGVLVVSNVGASLGERAAFWESYERDLVRQGQISHLRVVAELPHRLDAPALRRTVERMAAEFTRRGLPHVGVVHRASGHGDARNVHVHWLLADRAGTVGPDGWRFPERKDRALRGPAFVAWLRELHADAVNGELSALDAVRSRPERGPAPPEEEVAWRRWYAGAYVDLGIDRTSQIHLGPHDAALERAGVPTWKGVWNGTLEARYEALRAASEDLVLVRDREYAADAAARALAASLGQGPLEREAAWEVLGAASAAAEDAQALHRAVAAQRDAEAAWRRGERARRRLAWAERTLADERDPVKARALRAAAAEARGALNALVPAGAAAARDAARVHRTVLAARTGTSRGLLDRSIARHARERLLGAYQRAEERERRLRRLPAVRDRLAAAVTQVTALGLQADRVSWLGADGDAIVRAAAPHAAADAVARAGDRLRAAGVLVGDTATVADAVRAVGDVLRLERLLASLELERQRARRRDPASERRRAEEAIRADAEALSLAVQRGLIGIDTRGHGPDQGAEGAFISPRPRGGVER